MKRLLTLSLLCLLALAPVARADEPNPDDLYFSVYTLMLKADTQVERGKIAEARTNYAEGLKILKRIQLDFPDWNPKVIKYRIGYFDSRVTATAPKPTPAKKPEPVPAASASNDTPPPATAAATGDPVEMKIKWATGKTYHNRLNITADADAAMAGQPAQKGQLKFTLEVTMSALKDRDGGGKELEMQLGAATLNLQAMGATMLNYDPANPGQNSGPDQLAAVLKKLDGAKLKFLTDANGNIESMEGLDDFVKRLAEADPTVNPAQIMQALPPDFSANLKQGLANMSGLPDKPVKIGDTWSPKVDAAMPEGVQQNYTYAFKGWEQHDNKRCALIQLTGDFSMKAGAMPGSPPVRARVSGSIWYDPELGMVVESNMKPDINLAVPGMNGSSTAVTLHLVVNSKLTEVADLAK